MMEVMVPYRFCRLFLLLAPQNGAFRLLGPFSIYRYGVDLNYKKQPLIRGRGVSYCKNLLSPRFGHGDGMLF